MRKFKVGDLVTVKQADVWYTYLDDCRLKKLGKTGIVVKTTQMTFNKDDIEWHFLGQDPAKLDAFPDNWTQTVYDCMVRFPDEPDKPIFMTEAHLKAFEMPERN